MTQERGPEHSLKIVRNKSGLVFDGTRILIHQVVGRANAVGDIHEARREFVEGYPWLTPGHFDAALDYYQDHSEEIEGEIAKERKTLALMAKYNIPGHGIDFDALERDPEYQILGRSN